MPAAARAHRPQPPLASLVVVAACLFALLSFYEPVMRATAGIGTFYEWYRLFGMTGYATIGVVAYAGGRPATSITIVTYDEAGSFPDVVDKDKYYYTAVRWAKSAGVISGYGNGKFGPDDLITREQLAVMLANYAAKVTGKDTSGSAEDFQSMTDAAKVSDWAVRSVGWCFRSGIISGTEDGRVMPQGNAMRAEATKMIYFLHTQS